MVVLDIFEALNESKTLSFQNTSVMPFIQVSIDKY